MSTQVLKLGISGGLFVLLFLCGFILSRSGKPYSTLLFNVHKFIGLGLIVYLVITLRAMHRVQPLAGLEIGMLVLAGVLFVVTIVAGGLLDALKSAPQVLTSLHHWLPYFTVAATAASLYLVIFQGQRVV